MDQYVEDNGGGKLIIEPRPNGKITLTLESQGWAQGEVYTSRLNMVDPDEVIYAIMKACGQEKDCPGPVIEALADQINHGIEARIDFPNGGPEEDPEKLRGKYVHTTPATAEEPRVWAGADEPIIDQLIGSVADARAKADAAYMVADSALREASESQETAEAHQHLAEHWDRRLEVVQRAMGMIPAPGKRGGIAAAFAGEEIEQTDRIEKALKIARFAADEERDIPGVDR